MSFLLPKGVSRRVPPRLVRLSRLLIFVGLLHVDVRRPGLARRRFSLIGGFFEIALIIGVFFGRHDLGPFFNCFGKKELAPVYTKERLTASRYSSGCSEPPPILTS